MADIIEVRLPPTSQYLPLLSAGVGVLAGILEFNYDDILQLRIAVSEAFELTTRWAEKADDASGPDEISIRFIVAANKMEILVTNRLGYIGEIDREHEEESCGTLMSLMDEVRFGDGTANEPLIRMNRSTTK